MTMKTNEHAQYTHLTVELVPTAEDAAMLQKTWDAHKKACNRFSQKFYNESLKGKNKYKTWKTAYASASWLAKGKKGGLHAVYGHSIVDIIKKAYKRNEQKGKLELILFGDYGEKNTKSSAIHFCWESAFQVDFTTKKCRLDLADGRRTIAFSIPSKLPEPPTSWKIIRAYLKLVYGSWYLTLTFPNPTAEMKAEQDTNVVGVDRGELNIATTFSPAKGAHSYKSIDYPRPCKGSTNDNYHKSLFARDVHVASEVVENEPPYTIFILEDLYFEKPIEGWSYRHFEDVLIYLAALRHQGVFYCAPYNTSITCPVCGHVEKANRLHDENRFICQNCGYGADEIVDDDENAARNIYNRGKEALEKELSNKVGA